MAHNLGIQPRTSDVDIHESVDFKGLLLSNDVLEGLKQAGFVRPSPIQLKAIPLGRCGLDLIVQAKSGTGKTAVFVVIALENIMLESPGTQVIVLAPTREIAVQIWEVFRMIGSHLPLLRCYTFIGGLPLTEDKQKLKKCHIAVGTPGRVKQLIDEQILRTESVRMFILDEADKLMEDGFQEQINWIYSTLPENKQMLALSATYPEILAQHLADYMRNPTFVRLNTSDPALLGIRQYYKKVPFHPLAQKAFENKSKCLMELLSSVAFNQCLVFSNYQLRAQSLSDQLNASGWPSTYISGHQDQIQRLKAMANLKAMHCRVLISTDLTSRGIDVENVNLVVNLDVPRDHETYLHRIGRAGRFGTYGAGITLACEGKEFHELQLIEDRCNTHIMPLPDPVPSDLAKASGYVHLDDLVTAEQIFTREEDIKPFKERRKEKSSIVSKIQTKNFPEKDNKVTNPKNGDMSPKEKGISGSKFFSRTQYFSPPSSSSSVNEDSKNKHSPRIPKHRRKFKGKTSPQPQVDKNESSSMKVLKATGVDKARSPKNTEQLEETFPVPVENEKLHIPTLGSKLKERRPILCMSFEDAVESYQNFMKSGSVNCSEVNGNINEGDDVAFEILALAAKEERKEVLEKVGELLNNWNFYCDSDPSKSQVHPSDSGIGMDMSAYRNSKSPVCSVSVGVNTTLCGSDIAVQDRATYINNRSKEKNIQKWNDDPDTVMNACDHHDITQQQPKPVREDLKYPECLAAKDTSSLEESDTTENFVIHSSEQSYSGSETFHTVPQHSTGDAHAWHNEVNAHAWHNEPRGKNAAYDHWYNSSWWDGTDYNQDDYYHNNPEYYNMNNDSYYKLNANCPNSEEPYPAISPWQCYWMAALSHPEQFYYQTYAYYYQYASHYLQLYKQTKANSRLSDIHRAQRSYIKHFAKLAMQMSRA